MNPLNTLVEYVDRNKGELSYCLSLDKEPVNREYAYRMVKMKFVHLHEEYEEDEVSIGIYKITRRGELILARTAGDNELSTDGHKVTYCKICERKLYIVGGFQETNKCGFCATGKLESVYDIGLTW